MTSLCDKYSLKSFSKHTLKKNDGSEGNIFTNEFRKVVENKSLPLNDKTLNDQF